MFEATERRLFWLAVLLIIVAYFVGFATDATTIGNIIAKLGLIFTGRNPNTGQFAGYPVVPRNSSLSAAA